MDLVRSLLVAHPVRRGISLRRAAHARFLLTVVCWLCDGGLATRLDLGARDAELGASARRSPHLRQAATMR